MQSIRNRLLIIAGLVLLSVFYLFPRTQTIRERGQDGLWWLPPSMPPLCSAKRKMQRSSSSGRLCRLRFSTRRRGFARPYAMAQVWT